mmetsp:Transcript_7068/g.21732  ORF Transcript_7068/g.21732 Transcript_7068/m.21732 type:complete len:111 (-) Transcript_7068:3056-3388(-)|eukprot:scaffold117978_cov27-Tisochrysis_lutea.AAC.3
MQSQATRNNTHEHKQVHRALPLTTCGACNQAITHGYKHPFGIRHRKRDDFEEARAPLTHSQMIAHNNEDGGVTVTGVRVDDTQPCSLTMLQELAPRRHTISLAPSWHLAG